MTARYLVHAGGDRYKTELFAKSWLELCEALSDIVARYGPIDLLYRAG